ncbi:MAG: hypothetical protein AAF742_03080 [Pseudomonadota bacterium]
MVLRRVIEHIQTQNWTAVALDFVIVVAGVFLGLQAQQWSEMRAEEERQKAYLLELRTEVLENNVIIEARSIYTAQVVEAAAETLAYLNSDGECGEDCARVLVDAFHASQAWGSNISHLIADEMRRQGLPKPPALKRMVHRYYFHSEGLDSTLDNAADYRSEIRRVTPIGLMRQLWQACFRLDENRIETIVEDCLLDIAAEDAAVIARRYHEHPTLADDLRYWAAQNDL